MTRNRLIALREKVANSVEAFLKRCDGQLENVMVAYTHVQHAQPISVAYWLSHYAAVILRDLDRLKRAYDGASVGMIVAGLRARDFALMGWLL
jgi:argininosuccinate lyase